VGVLVKSEKLAEGAVRKGQEKSTRALSSQNKKLKGGNGGLEAGLSRSNERMGGDRGERKEGVSLILVGKIEREGEDLARDGYKGGSWGAKERQPRTSKRFSPPQKQLGALDLRLPGVHSRRKKERIYRRRYRSFFREARRAKTRRQRAGVSRGCCLGGRGGKTRKKTVFEKRKGRGRK